MIPGVNITEKTSVVSINGAVALGGALRLSAGVLGGRVPLRKLLGSKEHLDWPKIDLNMTKIITI